ncbi:phosphatase PAP2 family protein [Sphingobacterium sp. Mn56C]|uniref:phosphatase PAP2 family protein n=1 Tax=Sphingobacterium sp. Mn56C TaxID=3395261 RepID=UPI003BE129C2
MYGRFLQTLVFGLFCFAPILITNYKACANVQMDSVQLLPTAADMEDINGFKITEKDTTAKKGFLSQVHYTALIFPAVTMTYGIVAQESHYLIRTDKEIRDALQRNIYRKIRIDDFAQYAGAASIFVLDAAGVKAKHSLKESLFTTVTAHLISTATVATLKRTTVVWRPDESAKNSFPSGHTATAFISAELLWQEYKDQSYWYGIAGYTVAAGTGFMRMYNNRHWLSDVAMGAGIGVLSTKIAYWLLPLVSPRLNHQKHMFVVVPSYNGELYGLNACFKF